MRHLAILLLAACPPSPKAVDSGMIDTGPECTDGHIEECPTLEVCCGRALGGCAVEMRNGGWLACDAPSCTETLEAVCLRGL
jgi:hypothetical protein